MRYFYSASLQFEVIEVFNIHGLLATRLELNGLRLLMHCIVLSILSKLAIIAKLECHSK
jgi:hypothetical protein